MSKSYYCLVAGLPELTIDDNKLSYTVADFKDELYADLADADKKLIDLFYLKFDNANVLKLLADSETTDLDSRGNFSADTLAEYISIIKDGGEPADKSFPAYLSTFIGECFAENAVADPIAMENRLSSLYYEYGKGVKNKFVASWFDFNQTVNNILVALTARKYKWDVAAAVVGDSEVCNALRTSGARDFGLSADVEYVDAVIKIGETPDIVEREKKIDTLRWEWMDENSFFCYFTIERLFVFLAQLEMVERWIVLDKEKGNQLFRNIINTLKNEVQIPAEFR